jgi:hypothetical protein
MAKIKVLFCLTIGENPLSLSIAIKEPQDLEEKIIARRVSLEEQSHPSPVVDARFLINVLMELQVAIRKISLYSISHAIVPGILENLEKQFGALFEFLDTVTFGITRQEILYKGGTLSSNNPVIRELARGLNQFNLASMTFQKGLTKEEILKFLKFLAEGRGQPPEKLERMLSQLHQETPSISLQFLSFGGAIKSHWEGENPEEKPGEEIEGKELWRGLVKKLVEEPPEQEQAPLNVEPENLQDLASVADLINNLCRGEGARSQSYERAIVRHLNEQAKLQARTGDRRQNLDRQLNKLLSNLKPEVREQIFRMALEETQKGAGSMEELLDSLPSPMLMEVLNQVQFSDQGVSAPMLSVLKKLTNLSEKDEKLRNLLSSRLEGHKDLFQELFTDRARRVFYPSSYRSLLDQEFTAQPSKDATSQPTGKWNIDQTELNHHLSLILLELLDTPGTSEGEYEGLINYMNGLWAGGLGEKTQTVLLETLLLLFRKLGSATEQDRPSLQKAIKKFINPEVLSHLVQTYRGEGDERVSDLLGLMREVAGAEVIPILLGVLETEGNLSVRKRLLGVIAQYGAAVIPFAVQRLNNEKWYVVRNMLVLLRDLQAKTALPQIARCIRHDSSKLRMTALQTIDALGKGTKFFYEALSFALKDKDPLVFRKAVGLVISNRDPRALEMITAHLQYSNQMKPDEYIMTILEVIQKTGSRELIPALHRLRRQLRLRFWQWNRLRTLYKAVNDALQEISARVESHV